MRTLVTAANRVLRGEVTARALRPDLPWPDPRLASDVCVQERIGS